MITYKHAHIAYCFTFILGPSRYTYVTEGYKAYVWCCIVCPSAWQFV